VIVMVLVVVGMGVLFLRRAQQRDPTAVTEAAEVPG
jgi:hypothetical protein